MEPFIPLLEVQLHMPTECYRGSHSSRYTDNDLAHRTTLNGSLLTMSDSLLLQEQKDSGPPVVCEMVKDLFGSVVSCLMTTACILVSPAMICMGSLYLYQCPRQIYIPIFLIVAGVFKIFILAMSMCQKRMESVDNSARARLLLALTNLLRGLTFSWYIAGCTWVYSSYEPSYVLKPEAPWEYCNKTVYLFSFWMLNSVLIVVGLICATALIILSVGIFTPS